MLNILEDQLEANERLSKNETKLNTILQTSQDGFWLISTQGQIMEVNEAYCSMSGYSRAELLTMAIADLEAIETAEDTAQHLQLVLAKGADRFESCHRRKDGSSFDVEVSVQFRPIDGGFCAVFLRDITERKAYQHELSIAATAFESQEAIMITDPHQVILRTNKAFSRVSGYGVEEAVGKMPSILKSGRHDVQFFKDMWDIINRDGYWAGEIWNRRKNGEEYPLWLTITAVLDVFGAVTNYVGTFIDISEHKQAEQTIHNLSYYDALTGLANRRLLLDRLKHASLSIMRRDFLGGILLINLDGFKIINETRGHEVGDLMLIELAKRIQACLYPNDILARLGSDEFGVLLDGLNNETEKAAQQAEIVAERIRHAAKNPFYLRGREYHCTVCIGISLFHNYETKMEELLNRAGAAMFQAKESGRDNIHFFDEGLQSALEERFMLESWLRKAIPEELCLFYQMQVDHQGNIFGAEVLIRWIHPDKGIISPASFIPMAEDSGLILPIGLWVLETACRQLKLWENNRSTRNLVLSVNVSIKQFHETDFVDRVIQVLSQTGADPSRLKLELTESMLVDHVEIIIEKMNALRSLGVLFSLDDFGTGFSSLSYLKRLPLDQLKIDQSFVCDLLTDPNDAAIVRTVIALGHSLGLNVIAEGVETEEQRNFLAVNGCHNYQGYLFGKPVPVGDFEKLLKR
jgi:diguanylate cyclase (GGDEF)-like protein/PAS domain S-box-containing protein